jgi:hypothetical protein
MEVYPIAADSLGTRSMATLVKAKGCNIFIDPGVALGPSRYGLPPHPVELERMEEHWREIKKFAQKVDVIVLTHYHYDHHDPREPEVYKDKYLLAKHPSKSINYSQKGRAKYFFEQVEGLPKQVEYSDGREFHIGETTIRFSAPVFHGTNSRLGYVTEVSVRIEDFCFLFTSDVEGPSLEDQIKFIIQENPNIIYLDGPLSYMVGYRYSAKSLDASVKNMIKLLKDTKVEKLIVDHHLMRDLKWEDRIKEAIDVAKKLGKEILTAAQFLGLENDQLEARRKELYGG